MSFDFDFTYNGFLIYVVRHVSNEFHQKWKQFNHSIAFQYVSAIQPFTNIVVNQHVYSSQGKLPFHHPSHTMPGAEDFPLAESSGVLAEKSPVWTQWGSMFEVFVNTCYYLVVSNIFYVHPYLGKIPNLTNICLMGWNRQLG